MTDASAGNDERSARNDGSRTGGPGITATAGAKFGWLSIAVAILFGLFYVYDLFEAISNVVGVTEQINGYNAARKNVDLAAVPTPWAALIADLIISPVIYGLAFFLGRRSGVVVRAVLFFVGLTVVAAVSLTLIAVA